MPIIDDVPQLAAPLGVIFLPAITICGHLGGRTHHGHLFGQILLSPDGPYAIVSPGPCFDARVYVMIHIGWACSLSLSDISGVLVIVPADGFR